MSLYRTGRDAKTDSFLWSRLAFTASLRTSRKTLAIFVGNFICLILGATLLAVGRDAINIPSISST